MKKKAFIHFVNSLCSALNDGVNQDKMACHPEEGSKFVVEDRPCSGSRQPANKGQIIGNNKKSFEKSFNFVKNVLFLKPFSQNPVSNEMLRETGHFSRNHEISEKVVKRVQHANFELLKKKVAFTLAEVLITLSILGVVAAIMIPSTVQKVTDRQTVTAVKRAYSIFDNAFQMMNVIEGKPSTWQYPNPESQQSNSENTTYFAQKLSNYLNISKFCGASKGCINYGHTCNTYHKCYKTLSDGSKGSENYTESTNNGMFVLHNGMTVNINLNQRQARIDEIERYQVDKNKVPMGWIRVDVNGAKGPNRNGYDVFYFYYNNEGLMSLNNNNITQYAAGNCDKTATSNPSAGKSCVKWIMKYNNMDYKYRDVTAEW